ncbi:rRNA processing/ribosome biogenesis-domain-containing protein [Chaetomium sp. MPI-CAGE-AT-0009]|nr:rRNA processing/ribosome biogenesis-domain-containing protein [Chaetomium sp. MPI-CAGE-AT-0009]
MAAPPDLKVLCRRLTSAPVDDLPRLCPLLVNHVLRCGGPLSAPQDANKAKDKSSETPMLVHKLRTHITTLLTGKSPAGRFAAVCLVKAVIDVGGWESLRASDSWLRGLIGVLQKPDPLASKELCIVTLTKIYMLLQGYQTLVREMVTPTLPSYVTACLQLIKAPASGKPPKVPTSFIDTVACSLSKLVVLYPTTLRPSAPQMKAALRVYIAPTASDAVVVPQSLRESSRRLFILLSYTAPKNGSSEEWGKAIRSTILDSHGTVDQIFRAVVESWESATGYRSQPVHPGLEPSGGIDSGEELPPWTGVQAGAERLIGQLEFLAEYFNNPTKDPVTVPLGELLDLTARITLVTPPSGSEDSVETNPAIGRDEKAELWSVLPDIHIAVLRLHHALIRRLRENAAPLATDILDQMVRVSTASRHIPTMRETAYTLTNQLLLLSGPTLPKLTVDSLAPLIQSTCHDILLSTGHLDPAPTTTTTTTTKQPQKPNPNSTTSTHTNADAYLTTPPLSAASQTHHQPPTSPQARPSSPIYSHSSPNRPSPPTSADCWTAPPSSRTAATPCWPAACTRTATAAAATTPASCRFWCAASRGIRRWRCCGEDEEMGVGEAGVGGVEEEAVGGVKEAEKGTGKVAGGWGVDAMDVDENASGSAVAESVNPFAVVTSTVEKTQTVPVRPASPLKRKSELFEVEVGKPPKRVDTGKAAAAQVAVMPKAKPADEKEESGDDGESDSEGSVQIDMTLDDDEEEEE